MDDPLENDLGLWIGRSSQMTPEEKITLLKSCWIPPMSYDFSKDVKPSERKFKHAWIQTYSPWLVYSKALKGGLCKFCVLFPPPIGSVKGILGSFMIKPFTRYKNLHEDCKKHSSNHWHKTAVTAARDFTANAPVDVQLLHGHKKL